MRLWHIHPASLPTSLLSRQHQTSHLLLTVIASGRELGGMSRYSMRAGFVAWAHLTAAEEMVIRGMRHDSPLYELWSRIPERKRGVDVYIPPTRYLRDRHDLLEKIGSVNKGGQMDDTRMSLDDGLKKFAEGLALAAARGLPGNALMI